MKAIAEGCLCDNNKISNKFVDGRLQTLTLPVFVVEFVEVVVDFLSPALLSSTD
jgi:hypothetical protein